MRHKTFLLVVGIIFSLITVLHLFRVILGWEVMIDGLVLSMWVSWLAIVAAGYLAVSTYRLWRKD